MSSKKNTPAVSAEIEPSEVSIDELEIQAAALRAKREGRKAKSRRAIQSLIEGGAQAIRVRQTGSSETGDGREVFEDLTAIDRQGTPKVVVALNSMAILIGLLRQNAHDPANSLAGKLNFDRNNLKNMLRALMSKAAGREISLAELDSMLEDSPQIRNSFDLVFDGFGLSTQSKETEIKAKIAEVVHSYNRLNGLKRLYGDVNQPGKLLDVGEALIDIRKGNKTVDEVMQNPPLQPEANAFKLDESVIQELLREVREGRSAQPARAEATPEPAPASNIDYNDFMVRYLRQPVIQGLLKLQEAFQSPDPEAFERNYPDLFGNNGLEEVLDKLNDADPDLRTGLGNELFEGARSGDTPVHVLKKIVESYRLENSEQLLAKLTYLEAILDSTYPALLGRVAEAASSEAPAESTAAPEPAPEPARPEMNYQKFVEEFMRSEETAAAYYPLSYLYSALSKNEAEYNEKLRIQYFNGMSLEALKAKIDELLGGGMAAQMEEEAKNRDYLTAMFAAVAKHYGYEDKPEDLKRRVLEIHKILGLKLSVDILHFEDPYRADVLNVS